MTRAQGLGLGGLWASSVLAIFTVNMLDNVPLGSRLGIKEVLFFRVIGKKPSALTTGCSQDSLDKPAYA